MGSLLGFFLEGLCSLLSVLYRPHRLKVGLCFPFVVLRPPGRSLATHWAMGR